ncbi:MAG: beta-propeller fold lactonase family protein [Methylobacillus sp.]|jgi:YVTN family beta-propeller protein|nr:beta-propeller fold lactonase family protein [Methylobacillus sp.]
MNSIKNYGLAAALLTALGASSGAMAADQGYAYVSNQDGGVTIIDLATLETTGDIDIKATSPRGIGITPDGKYIITANRDDGNISVIDRASGTVEAHIPIGKNPEFVRVLGDKVFVSYEPDSAGGPPPKPGEAPNKDDDDDGEKQPAEIAIVDLAQGKVTQRIVGGPETEGIEFSADGKQLVITNESDNTITVHDMQSGKLLKTIQTHQYGDRPRGIKVAPDGSFYVSTLEYGNKILVLDKDFNVKKTVDTANTPYGISFDPQGKRLFVAANKAKLLQVFDAQTFEKIKDIPVGDRCWHFSFTPDQQNVLLACGKSNAVYVIDADKLEVTKQIADKKMPWGIVTYPKSAGSLDKP